MERLMRTLFKPYPEAPISKVRVSDGEDSIVMDYIAYSMTEEDLRYLFMMYKELGA